MTTEKRTRTAILDDIAHRPVCILVSSAAGHTMAACSLATTHLHPVCEKVTAKAVQLRFRRNSPRSFAPGRDLWHEFAWVPKRALVKVWESDNGTVHCKLAEWFRPEGYTASVLDRFAETSFISS